MFLPLSRNKIIRLKQALVFSACFFYSVFNGLAQNKWEDVPGVDVMETVSALVIDSFNQLVIGGEFLDEVNGLNTCSVFLWSPESGVQILDTLFSPYMHVRVVRDILVQNDSMLVGGDWGLVIYKNGSFIPQINDPFNGTIWDLNKYQNRYLFSTGLGSYYDGVDLGQFIEWDGDTGLMEFENITNFMEPQPAISVSQVYKGELYVAGRSSSAFGGIMDHIMKWNGTNWEECRWRHSSRW